MFWQRARFVQIHARGCIVNCFRGVRLNPDSCAVQTGQVEISAGVMILYGGFEPLVGGGG